jgi:hypothetical protein
LDPRQKKKKATRLYTDGVPKISGEVSVFVYFCLSCIARFRSHGVADRAELFILSRGLFGHLLQYSTTD